MRFAVGSLTSAAVLFVASAIGAVGAWALPVSAFALLAGAVIGAIVMEEHDLGGAERLATPLVRAKAQPPSAVAESSWNEAA